MTVPDFRRAYMLARLSALVYDTKTEDLAEGVEALGLGFVAVLDAPGFQALVVTEPEGGQIVAFRGTPVTCGRDIEDAVTALGYDAGFAKTRIGGAKVLRGPYHALQAQWSRIQGVMAPGRVTFTGHSLGAVFALLAMALTPRTVNASVVCFAPFQAADAAFWKACFEGRTAPVIFARACDFAPGHDHLDPETTQPWPLWHLVGGACASVTAWPFCDESIADHDVADYVADLKALAGEPAEV